MNFEEIVESYRQSQIEENMEKAVSDLVSEMSLKEKVYMLSGHTIGQTQIDMIKTGRNYNVSALRAGGCRRLGVPAVFFTDGPRGVVMHNSTCFPVSMMRASSFDRDLEYRFGKAIADEALAQGANYYAGVCINLLRNPRWGRSQETYGEDPFLLGEFGAALTRSVQEEGMIACPKHFALNSIEDLRFYIDVNCDDRTLYEVYLPHFRKCIDAGALSIMGAYNKYDGEYCCGNRRLLTDILRKEWGFRGFVMSDFVWGVRDAEKSLNAGLNMEMMFTQHYSYSKVRKLVKEGKVSEDKIDELVREIVRALVIAVSRQKPRNIDTVGSQEHRALAREIAEKGMVLLENNGILPLSADTPVSVVGPYANVVNVGDHGSSRVFDRKVLTALDGIRKVFSDVREDAGVSIVCVGNDYRDEGEYFASTKENLKEKPKNKGGDRDSLKLKESDVALIRREKEKGNRVIVVLYSGSAILTEEWREYADAIIMNFYSGCEGASALAELIAGKKNFSGKLTFTVGKSEEQYPEIIGIGQKPYQINYGYYHGYTLFDKKEMEARYPFGHGLSYSSFEIRGEDVSLKENEAEVSVSVRNVSNRDGAEVVQVYVSSSEESRPVKLLKGFERVELKAGEEKKITISIPLEEMRFYIDGCWTLDGKYAISVGNSAGNAQKIGTVEI